MGREEEVLFAMEQEVRRSSSWQRMHPPCCKPYCLLYPHYITPSLYIPI
jgi:hypothetical protein